jgi:DNA-binding transcriptional MerR regulator
MLKVGQVAKQIGVSPTWIRDNTKEFAGFSSPTATPPPKGIRLYDDNDMAMLATVKRLKGEGQDNEQIAAALTAGEPLDRPPDPPESRQDAPPQETAIVAQAMSEVAPFRGKMEAVEDERDRLVVQLADTQAAQLVAITRAAAAEAKLELIEREAVISVVHSLDNKPPPESEKPRSWLDRLLGR